MATPVIVEAVRTPIGRRGGWLSGLKAVELLRLVQVEVIRRAGIEPAEVGQIIGGCVTQAGEQSLNVTRNAWLSTGLPWSVPASTVDTSCGSAQQANHLISALIAADVIDIGIACGVESMSRVPIGVNLYQGPGHYKTRDYPWDDPPKSQFGGAERIARREGLSRADLDGYGLLSQRRAARAWAQGRFAAEVVPVDVRGGDPVPGAPAVVDRDQGVRETTPEGLAAIAPAIPDGLHTAGTISQVSDGAAAVLWMSRDRALALGLRPRAILRHQAVVGADPYFLLDGPIEATRTVLGRASLKIGDIDRYEINEAFAAVVLAWRNAYDADLDRLNVSGGAISLGHPLGASGARLLVTALHELERTDGTLALVAMCCGGSLGTAAILERC
ncbi:steroid 3-ketoacyl-CoA thiolase [Micromonospora sp. FIMYZ51]|uniref:steroid 3-ketoacyl-CoA thiolase n=1 Tax=Micromonospora sp. FIMYZ51 TaxID=3051832 RepID=UPI00311E3381